jgi:serine/threonine protein kinase
MAFAPYTSFEFPEIEDYAVERRPLHFGTDASVYVGRRLKDEKEELVAIKLVPRERYADEAKFSEILSKHKGFVPVLELRWLEEFVMLVFPFMDGGDLLNYVHDNGPLDPLEVVEILRGILEALAFAHSIDISLVDVTIENILLQKNGTPRVKLCDYDQCVFVDHENPKIAWNGLISKRTRPPELYRRADYDPRKLDIFGVGVIAALMCASPNNYSKIITKLNHISKEDTNLEDLLAAPRLLRSFISSLLTYDPEVRPEATSALRRLDEVKRCLLRRSSAIVLETIDDLYKRLSSLNALTSAEVVIELIKEADTINDRIVNVSPCD